MTLTNGKAKIKDLIIIIMVAEITCYHASDFSGLKRLLSELSIR
jgi:hypothetical protein